MAPNIDEATIRQEYLSRRMRVYPEACRMEKSLRMCGTSWKRTAMLVARPTVAELMKEEPMATPSTKLWSRSLAARRDPTEWDTCTGGSS